MGIVRIGRVDLLLDADIRPNGPLVSVSCTMSQIILIGRQSQSREVLQSPHALLAQCTCPNDNSCGGRSQRRKAPLPNDTGGGGWFTLALRVLRTVYGDA